MEKPYRLVVGTATLVVTIFCTTLIGIYAFSKGVTWLSIAAFFGTMLVGELYASKFLSKIATSRRY